MFKKFILCFGLTVSVTLASSYAQRLLYPKLRSPDPARRLAGAIRNLRAPDERILPQSRAVVSRAQLVVNHFQLCFAKEPRPTDW